MLFQLQTLYVDAIMQTDIFDLCIHISLYPCVYQEIWRSKWSFATEPWHTSQKCHLY